MEATFVLSRSPELQVQFARLLSDQQDPASPRYHQWLTPQQVGEQYGPTQNDLDALRQWLGSQGLAVKEVAPSGIFVRVSGSALQLGSALDTEFHYFEGNGGLRIATTAEPAIPSVFAPIVTSISGLAKAELRPMYHAEARPMGAVTNPVGVHPEYSSNGNHFLSPGDFATIFDLNPVYSAGYNGAGQKVAVIGESRVANSDMTAFESKTGLPSSLPNVVIPTNGVDPGITNDGYQGEATLDVQRVIGVAPGAQVDLVVSADTANTQGIVIATQYEVQMLLDPVMNLSFGGCEGYNGASSVAMWDALFSQAASEGISVFISSGDSGAAACDESFTVAPSYQFLSINEICSSSYVTCVGGTQLADTANPSQYWSSTNSSTSVSALGYIPEGAWNESGTYKSSIGGYPVAAGGGGASIYVPKPAWQTGTGVPADHARDVPDVSFPSASHDGFMGCFAAGGADCGAGYFVIFAGTSTAAPSMAGVAAILNQKIGGSQGNLNPLLYRLAASNPGAFHDTTPGSSGISSCSTTIVSICNNSTPSYMSTGGGLAGYSLTVGYDLATGLGSLDIANFLAAASSVSHPSVAATTLAVHGSATTISDTQTATFTATVSSSRSGMPTGTIQFYANGNALGSPVTVSSGNAMTGPMPFTSAGTYYITATYSGDSSYAASTAPGVTLVVTGQSAATTITPGNASIYVQTTTAFSVNVKAVSGSATPTGVVRLFFLGNNYEDLESVPLVNGTGTTAAIRFPTVGSYTVIAEYQGDTVFSPSNSAQAAITVTKLPTFATLANPVATVGAGGGVNYPVVIGRGITGAQSFAPAPTGTAQFYINGIAQGSPFTVSATPPPLIFPSAGTFTVTATYSGDAYWLPSTTNALTQVVLTQPAAIQMTHTTQTLTITAGASNSNADLISTTGTLGFTGTVNLACTVTYNGTGTASSPPGCSLTTSSWSFAPGPQTWQSPVSISTTARSRAAVDRLPNRWAGPEAIALCGIAFWLAPLRRRSWRALLTVFVSISGLIALSGCGGSNNPSTPPGTTAGSYTVTISATTNAAGIAAPAPLTIALTVN